jgi:hypothetical protein
MVVLLPLYGIPEAGTHWFKTYHDHHIKKLQIRTSTFDPCLLISTQKGTTGIIGMQTDDTLMLMNQEFAI